MNRKDLDAFIAHYRLSQAGIGRAFVLAGALPTALDTRRFALRVMRIAAVLSLAAGVIFFIAANWELLGVFGHFALVQAAFLLAIVAALWRPPPHVVGRLALLGAFILTGALLALFGQTYQTGADVYELFFIWAALGLPLVVAAQWSGAWAAWLVVLNVALLLFCGFMPGLGLLGLASGTTDTLQILSLLLPMLVNLVLWFVPEASDAPRVRAVAPQWLRRVAVSFGVGYAIWAGGYLIFSDKTGGAGELLSWLVLAVALGAVALYALRKRTDVLPMAAVIGSLILLGLFVLLRFFPDSDETGWFLVMAMWLIVTSTAAGKFLMSLQRAWLSGAKA